MATPEYVFAPCPKGILISLMNSDELAVCRYGDQALQMDTTICPGYRLVGYFIVINYAVVIVSSGDRLKRCY
jgi:hypothetical protein